MMRWDIHFIYSHIGYALLGDQLHLVAREVVGADIKGVRELE